MKLSAITSALLVAGASAAAVPAKLQARQDSGSYSIPGLGARKQQVTAAGANSFDLAIAMLETDNMDTNVSTHPSSTALVCGISTNIRFPLPVRIRRQ
jgi:hypothetical protein